MKKITTKLIIVISIIIAIIYTIYNISLSKERKKENQENIIEKEKIIATNMRIGIINFDTVNPILSNNANVQNIGRIIFDPLINLTQDFKLEPCLAKEWTNLDEKNYLIKLRENVKWQDGKVFNSDDVIFTVKILKDMQSIYSYNVEKIDSIQKIDEYTIKIITKEKIPYFEYNLIFPIMSSKYFNEKNFTFSKKNSNPVGTGMYYIADNNKENITLKKNTNWWGNKELKLDTIKLNLYKNTNEALADFKTKEVDLLTTSLLNIDEYTEGIQYKKTKFIGRNYDYIAFNCKNNTLQHKEVRQSISKAINKEKIIEQVYQNQYQKSSFPLDFGCFLYSGITEESNYSKEKAQEVLKKWSKNKTINLKLLVNQDDKKRKEVSKIIKQQIEEIGINVIIVEKKEKQYQKDIQNGNYEMVLTGTTYGYSPSLNLYFNKQNIANYTNNSMIQKVEEMEKSQTEEEQRKKLLDIIKIYQEETPYISLYYDTINLIYSDNLKGEITPNSYNIFYHIENWYREYDKV